MKLQSNGSWPFPKRQILDSSKLNKFADDNSNFDENARKFFNFSFSHSCFQKTYTADM